jgi:endonuclease/exonuclease/phosphatase (EEP) superfamily protein YafD
MTAGRFARAATSVVVGMAAAGATTLVLMGQLGRTRHSLDQINAFLPLLLTSLAVVLAMALGLRDRIVVAVAGIGLAVGGYQLGGAALHGWRDRAEAQGSSVKILTLSAFHANPDPGAIRDAVTTQAPDIALLQESNGTAAPVIETLLPGYHRLGSCKKRDCTLTILSRWPLRRIEITYGKPAGRPDLLAVEVDAPFGTFRVMNVHLPRPLDRTAKAYAQRIAEAARANDAQPLIMAGDFNTATGSFGLDQLERASGLHRRDGFIPTYPANRIVPAFTGIDHVFANHGWTTQGCRRTAAGNSDHYGVACRLQFRPDR